jgi:hypothetical protein
VNVTTGLSQWANDNMALLITGLIVVLAASILITRALRRAKAARAGLTVEQRDARARRIEDGLTIAVAAVASGLSLTGLWHYAADVLHLNGAARVLPYFGLDAAVIVCAIRARRRARNNEASGWNGRLVWIFALISAAFGFSEGGSLWGGIGRAVWPLIAATLFELGLIEQRHAAQRDIRRRLSLGWAHPIERLRVYATLSADSTLTADDATHQVRVNAAARALHRLRHADTIAEHSGRLTRGWARWHRRRVEHRTQRALLRANFSDPQVTAEVLQRTQSLVRTLDFARMDYSDLDDARAMLTDAIDHTVLPATKRRPARRTDSTAAEHKTAPTAPATEKTASQPQTAPAVPARHAAPAPADESAPAPEKTAPATAPATPTAPAPRTAPDSARALPSDFEWSVPDSDLKEPDWEIPARNMLTELWLSGAKVDRVAGQIARDTGYQGSEAPMRKRVAAWKQELTEAAARVDQRQALRRELRAADPAEDDAPVEAQAEDRQPAHVA